MNLAATLPPRPFRLVAGVVVAIGIAALIAAVMLSILAAAGNEPASSGSRVDMAQLLVMTSVQAALSTILSLIVGVALAWALNRLRFPGRGLVVALFASAIVTPGIIVAFGLLAVWGRSGWINAALAPLGLSIGNPLFGLAGILAAHVILDGAFAARILLGRLDAIPTTRLKTGQSLGLDAWRRFAVIDWPAMRGTLPGLGAIVFLLAFTSFPIVLMLGGGPANQTLEVAIYAAVRLDFDLRAAVSLGMVQVAVCAGVILAASALPPVQTRPGPMSAQTWFDAPAARAVQVVVLTLCLFGFALPLLSVLMGGFADGAMTVLARPSFLTALATSLVIASASSALTLALCLAIAMARAATPSAALRISIGVPAYAYLAVPAVALSLGFFLLVRSLGMPTDAAAPAVVVIANALLALPFAVATLSPPLDLIARGQGRLIRSLGLGGARQFARVELPLIGRDIGLVIALAFCFSFGDLGVIALFGTEDFSTLPLAMLRALGGYRSNDAAVIAAVMLAITVVAFAVLPPLIERLVRNARR